jgi:hypothetical protein
MTNTGYGSGRFEELDLLRPIFVTELVMLGVVRCLGGVQALAEGVLPLAEHSLSDSSFGLEVAQHSLEQCRCRSLSLALNLSISLSLYMYISLKQTHTHMHVPDLSTIVPGVD